MDLFFKQNVIHGDCLEVMRGMEANSIDCILTDPPYGLSFMGKHWDKGVPDQTFWAEALRVCKPGATMLAFGGTRTYHRLTCAIEDAGWEIRDCMMWLYGSGFPKSHNFGKQLGGDWEGYGTALKPAYEPIILCMKPLDGTFAKNAEKWGVAGIDVDASRIVGNINSGWSKSGSKESENNSMSGKNYNRDPRPDSINGRWPSNLLLDEEAAEMLDEQSGILKSGSLKGILNTESKNQVYGKYAYANINPFYENSGGASRFFYCAKASPSERQGSTHPTMKPTKLLEYLLKLIMPPNPNAIVLDPFCGSGSTLVAAKNLGFNAVGIEIEEEYCNIARHRIE